MKDEGNCCYLMVHAVPNARQNALMGWVEDDKGQKVLKVRVRAVPEDGKANAALCSYLAELLKLPLSGVELVRGGGSRHKILKINKKSDEVMQGLSKVLAP